MSEVTNPICSNDKVNIPGTIKIRALEPRDHENWKELYKAYAAFYQVPMNTEILERTWQWLQNPTHSFEGLVAQSEKGIIGFAHYWPQPRPLQGQYAGFLDDLFVDPTYRSQGVGRLLISALEEIAHMRGWTMLSWVTAQDNVTARRLYDDVAKPANWVTYERII
ncbi:N-acetyltransferase family protein [Brucellaceae bacterium C25G]